MKKLLMLVFICSMASILFAAYPNEYPIYLGFLGFSKDEIRELGDGGFVKHSIKNRLPGEYGTVVAQVWNIPVYYFRDYYSYIENYKTLFNFQNVGEFKEKPDLQDLKALQIDAGYLKDLLSCRPQDCKTKLSGDEIASLPKDVDLSTQQDRERLSDAYRQILLNRLLSYQQNGMNSLQKYEDSVELQDPAQIFQAHLESFPHLEAYFPLVQKYMMEYPQYRIKRVNEFFFWAKEYLGNKPVTSLRHAFVLRVGEDFLLVNKLIYSDHYLLSSIAIMHLINYADQGVPRTLFVFEQRTLTDLKGNPLDALGRNILRSNLEKRVASGFKFIGKTVAERYQSRQFIYFPFGLLPRDQR